MKWMLLGVVVLGMLSLGSGVVQVTGMDHDGSMKLDPKVNGAALRWYAKKAWDLLPAS